MAGTKLGGLKASKTNKKRHGKNFYKVIGAVGGRESRGGGFAHEERGKDGLTGQERARLAGAKGGRNSKRS